jgi:hypothetical protein
VLINESGSNSGIIGAIDGGIVTIKNGTMVNSVTDGHGNITDSTVFVGDQSKLVLDNASILQGIVHVGAAGEIDTVSGTSNTINTADGLTHNTTAPSLTIDEGGSVVVGHGPLDPDNSPRHIHETRRYIQDFIRLKDETATAGCSTPLHGQRAGLPARTQSRPRRRRSFRIS